MTARSSIAILQGADQFFPALIKAVSGAQHTIYLEFYLVNQDPDTERVLDALVQAQRRGVMVHLLLDGYGSLEARPWITQRLEGTGVAIEFYRPGVRWLAPETWRRLHRKLVLIDQSMGFVGGINLMGDRYDLGGRELSAPRLDFAVSVNAHRTVESIARVMRRSWWRVSLSNLLRTELLQGSLRRYLRRAKRQESLGRVREVVRQTRRHLRWRAPPMKRHASSRVRLLLRDNFRFRRSIELWYRSQIDLARQEILIANAYFVPTLRFREALIRAARRGVRVRLLIQGNSDQWWTDWATQALVEELAREEIEIFFYQPSFLHAKVAVIDDSLTVGSSNIDPFSLMFSLEANLVAQDSAVAAQLRTMLEAAIAESVPKNEKLYRRRGPIRALGRRMVLTAALMLLRTFLAFGRVPYR